MAGSSSTATYIASSPMSPSSPPTPRTIWMRYPDWNVWPKYKSADAASTARKLLFCSTPPAAFFCAATRSSAARRGVPAVANQAMSAAISTAVMSPEAGTTFSPDRRISPPRAAASSP